jgi:hypothetical protein
MLRLIAFTLTLSSLICLAAMGVDGDGTLELITSVPKAISGGGTITEYQGVWRYQ